MNTNIIPIKSDASAEYWADRICKSHAASVEQIIQTGRELLAAKARLSHGEWGRLTGRDGTTQMIPFSDRAAAMHMLVAKHAVLSNEKHVSHLPTSWGTLAQLARLPAPTVERLIAEAAIHPELPRSDAEAMVREWQAAQITGTRPMFRHEQQITPAAPAELPPPISPERLAELNAKLTDAVTSMQDGAAQSAAIKESVRGAPAPQGAWAEVLGHLAAIADMTVQLQESLEDRLQPLPLPMGDTHTKLRDRLAQASRQLATLRAHIETTYLNGAPHAHH